EFLAAVADEYELHLFLEPGHVGDVRHPNGAAAEDADVRELVEMRRRDGARLHAAHRKTGHRAVWLVRERAEVRVDVGNQIFDHDLLECVEVKRSASRTCACRSCIGWTRTTDATVFHHDDERLASSF